jgi:hypothetical protein
MLFGLFLKKNHRQLMLNLSWAIYIPHDATEKIKNKK